MKIVLSFVVAYIVNIIIFVVGIISNNESLFNFSLSFMVIILPVLAIITVFIYLIYDLIKNKE